VGHPVQPSCQSRVTQSRLHRTLSRRVLGLGCTFAPQHSNPLIFSFDPCSGSVFTPPCSAVACLLFTEQPASAVPARTVPEGRPGAAGGFGTKPGDLAHPRLQLPLSITSLLRNAAPTYRRGTPLPTALGARATRSQKYLGKPRFYFLYKGSAACACTELPPSRQTGGRPAEQRLRSAEIHLCCGEADRLRRPAAAVPAAARAGFQDSPLLKAVMPARPSLCWIWKAAPGFLAVRFHASARRLRAGTRVTALRLHDPFSLLKASGYYSL